MKIIDLSPVPPTMAALLEAVEDDDVVLVRAGHPVVRLEKFDLDDWEDWKYEHSDAAIERGKAARHQYRTGEFHALSRQGSSDRTSKATEFIRSLYERTETAILKLHGHGEKVTRRATKGGATFFANGRRFVSITIQRRNLKVLLVLQPGKLHDPKNLTAQTKIGRTISMSDEQQFHYVMGLIRQAFANAR